VQAEDALTVAISTISTVLGQTLPDAAAVTTALAETPALIILDNLEAVSEKALKELLDAAVGWSEAGKSRVLLTSRKPDFNHAAYRTEGTWIHRRIALEGLGSKQAPDDAIDWFLALSKLPPEPSIPAPGRDALIALFDRVQFHPLSIAVLAQQLKTRTADALGERLEAILHQDMPIVADGTPKSLIASLKLSLERLTEEERHAVRLLGFFRAAPWKTIFWRSRSWVTMTKSGRNSRPRSRRWRAAIPAPYSAVWGGIFPMTPKFLQSCWLSFRILQSLKRSPASFAPDWQACRSQRAKIFGRSCAANWKPRPLSSRSRFPA
jgi:hypothetical protein